MAPVALFCCIIFILIGIREDIKECRHVWRGLWIPFIWLFVSSSRPISAWFNPSRALVASTLQDYVQGSPIDRAFLIVLIFGGFVVLYRRRSRFHIPFHENAWLILLYVYASISVGWSDYQGVSARRWVRAAGDIIMVLIILTEDDQSEAVEHILRRCAIIVLPLSVVLIKWFRNIGVLYNSHGTPFWAGVAQGKNELGLLCALTGIFIVWRLLKTWPKFSLWDVALLALVFYLLRGARSSTSNVMLTVGVLLLVGITFLKSDSRKVKTFIIVSILAILVLQGFITSFLNESIVPIFFSTTGRDASFTGRVPLWSELIKIGSQNPLHGTGYGSFWIVNMTRLWEQFVWGPTNAHNGYLDVFLDLGVIGLVFLIPMIIQTFNKIMRSLEEIRPIAMLLLVFLTMVLTHNFTESSIMRPTNILWFLFLLSSIVVHKTTVPEAQDQQAPAAVL